MCPKHGILFSVVCDVEVCGLCYAETLEQEKFGNTKPWPREEVEMYFATHLTHGKINEFHRNGFKV